MDQEAWNQIYTDLERDIAALRSRGVALDEMAVILEIDRARFAMDRGENDEAVARIQQVKSQLRGPASAVTRSVQSSPAADRLDALEDNLHSTMRLGSARLEIVGDEEEPPTRAASQNTKVNKSIKYEDIKDEYLKLWTSCSIRADKASAVKMEADRLLKNRAVYEEISAKTSVPWWFIGLIHGMECSYSLGKHLHNGDSLKARTWQVPAGRPKNGNPPFTFQESAIDALEVDGFAGKTDWPLETVLFRLERYNGFGYRKKFGFASPYLWSYTSHFSSGKYVKDGVFDPNAPSKQCGTAATLKLLLDKGIVSFEEKKPEAVAAVAPAVKPEPATEAKPVPVPATAPSAPAQVGTPAPAPAVPASSTGEPEIEAMVSPSPATPAAAAPAQTATPAPTAAPAPAPAAPVPVAVPAPASAPAPPADAPAPAEAPAGPATADGNVSPAVAAALAELAKRSKS